MRATTAFAFIAGPLLALGSCAPAAAQLVAAYPAGDCPDCADWNAPQPAFRIFGNTYFVGTRGLSALLITSPRGHLLIDGGLPNSAPLIMENIAALGFDLSDVKLILNPHAHFDHAGGIAALQRRSGARVAASVPSAPVLERGGSGPDDPQYGALLAFPGVSPVERLADGQVVSVGPISLTCHLTAGHTPGGTTWSWTSCEGAKCLNLVYADSQTPVSAHGFEFSTSTTYPAAIADFERGFAVLDRLPCDVLITPHPAASSFWLRLEEGADGLVDPGACRQYSDSARRRLARRLEAEGGGK